MKRKKATCQRAHAKRRALERFGLDLSRTDLKEIVKIIQTGSEAKLVQKQSNRVKIYDLNYKQRLLRVVYDKLRQTPVTFLDPMVPVKWELYNEKSQPWMEFKPYLYHQVPKGRKEKVKLKPKLKVHLPKRKRRRLRGKGLE